MDRHLPLRRRIAAGALASFLVVGVASCGDDDGGSDPLDGEVESELDLDQGGEEPVEGE